MGLGLGAKMRKALGLRLRQTLQHLLVLRDRLGLGLGLQPEREHGRGLRWGWFSDGCFNLDCSWCLGWGLGWCYD